MGGANAPAPMDGASDVPPSDPNLGGEAPPMDDPNAMSEDPALNPPADGGMGGDPSMNDGTLDPNMNGDVPADDGMSMDGEDGEAGDDSTMSLFNQLSDDDKEAARGYIESMLSRDEEKTDDSGMDGNMPMGPDGQNDAPMMESVMITKKQARGLSEVLNKCPNDNRK